MTPEGEDVADPRKNTANRRHPAALAEALLAFLRGLGETRGRSDRAAHGTCHAHPPKREWSGWRGSNPRHSAWEADVLPLNYTRVRSSCSAHPGPRTAASQP